MRGLIHKVGNFEWCEEHQSWINSLTGEKQPRETFSQLWAESDRISQTLIMERLDKVRGVFLEMTPREQKAAHAWLKEAYDL